MTDQLQFEQRSDGLWVTFVERQRSSWARRGWAPRYERVSTHRSVERAMEQANRHQRDRAKLAKAS